MTTKPPASDQPEPDQPEPGMTWSFAVRGRVGTAMSVVRLPQSPVDLRRQGACPVCRAFKGEHCFDRPRGGVHRERLVANGISPDDVPGYGAALAKRPRRKR